MTLSATFAGSRLWSWLQATPPYPKALAWCHNTDAYVLRRIIEQGHLAPCACPVFGEELLYFFYGRPAYRVGNSESMRISGRSPVVIILDSDVVSDGRRLYPFDSGAFASNRYANWVHESMSLADFELACPSDAPQRHVASFFGTNKDYLLLNAKKPSAPYSGEFEVDSLVAILLDPSTESADDRRLAMELQIDKPIAFKAPSVKALVVPAELLQSPWLNAFVSGPASAGIEIVPYDLARLKLAGAYQALIEQQAVQMQRDWGLE